MFHIKMRNYRLLFMMLVSLMATNSFAQEQATEMKPHADSTFFGAEGYLPYDASLYNYPIPLFSNNHFGYLHSGLNVSMGLSVFAMFGKNAPSGAGFSQNLTATYLRPLGKKSWMAVGGYVDHINWSGNSFTTGGLQGQLGYQFDEHWAAYLYGQKSIINNGVQPYGFYHRSGLYGMSSPLPYDKLGDKLGAAVRWTPNPTLSIELSVEKNSYPSSTFGYSDRYKYNYPLPQR